MAKDLQPYGADQELLEDLADRIDAADALAELGSGPGMPWEDVAAALDDAARWRPDAPPPMPGIGCPPR